MPIPRRIGLLGFDGVAAIDLVGVSDAFHLAATAGQPPQPRYETCIVGLTAGPFTAESGLRMLAAPPA